MAIRCLTALLLLMAGSSHAAVQNLAGRQAAKSAIQQKMTEYFISRGRPGIPPRSSWSPSDVGEISVLLENELERAKAHVNGSESLAALDCMEEAGTLRQKDLNLKVEVAWSEGFFDEAAKSSKKSDLAPLMNALIRERQGKQSSTEPSSEMLLRARRFEIVGTYMNWQPCIAQLLKGEITKILASDAYMCRGEVPEGFNRRWLTGVIGPAEKWDATWD